MNKPRIKVDFNELLEEDLVLLSKTDERQDSKGNVIKLSIGIPVSIYEFNRYDDGLEEYLFADGVVELNTIQKNPVAKWCCRIDKNGITTKNT